MQQIELTLTEVLALDLEINGFRNPTTQEIALTGVANLSLPLVAKYWVSKLGKIVSDEKTRVESFKNDLIKKHGSDASGDGNFTINVYTDDSKQTYAPEYLEYSREMGQLLAEKISIEYKPIKLSAFENITTNDQYNVFYRFVDDSQ